MFINQKAPMVYRCFSFHEKHPRCVLSGLQDCSTHLVHFQGLFQIHIRRLCFGNDHDVCVPDICKESMQVLPVPTKYTRMAT